MWCHLLLAAPVIGLVVFAFLPLPLALPLYGLVALGSLALYAQVWRSLKLPAATGREAMLGAEARAVTDIRPRGLVWCNGELWRACSGEPIPQGAQVEVAGFEGLRVIVRRKEVSRMAKDPVCGMDVDEKKAAARVEHMGKTYYFCSQGCKAAFEKDPHKYTQGKMGAGSHHGHH